MSNQSSLREYSIAGGLLFVAIAIICWSVFRDAEMFLSDFLSVPRDIAALVLSSFLKYLLAVAVVSFIFKHWLITTLVTVILGSFALMPVYGYHDLSSAMINGVVIFLCVAVFFLQENA